MTFARLSLLVLLLSLAVSACSSRVAAVRSQTYVAIGASDAVGVGARNPDTEGWVPQFGARLGREVRVVNLGVSGSTLAQALDEQLAPALDAEPDVITVWLAVNDLNARVPLDRYTRDLDRLLATLSQTHARVLVGNVPDLAPLAVYAGRDPAPLQVEVDRWNAAIDVIASRHGVTVVDLHSRWQEVVEHPEYLSQDGFHPSSEGYAALADVFYEAFSAGQ